MANKTVTMTVPVANDVTLIQVRCDGAGNVTVLAGNVTVASSDGSAHYDGSFNFDMDNLPEAAQKAVTNLVAECLIKFKADEGF